MTTRHEWDIGPLHYRAVYDEDYDVRGSFALGTDEEDKAAEDEVITKVNSGEWVVIGIIVTRPCPGPHCESCSGRIETDSLWGIVVENTDAEIERFAAEGM